MSVEALIREAMESGARLSFGACEDGSFSAAVFRPSADRYTTRRDADPIAACRAALIEDERLGRVPPPTPDPRQIDLEDVLAAAPADEFEGLL